MDYNFNGKWITNANFANLQPRNVFHRQLEKVDLDCSKYRNQHILFRKKFQLNDEFLTAKIYITADDYYKLYINGQFVGQGPAPSYHFRHNYNEIDISRYLIKGENLISVHTYYQGIINRVWQSGDFRHGMICDVVIDDKVVVCSDKTFKTKIHSAYKEIGISGYATQFLEEFDSRSEDIGFEKIDFDDSNWEYSQINRFDDHTLVEQKSKMLDFEKIYPKKIEKRENSIFYDFGANYVGYLCVTAKSSRGNIIIVRCAQELEENGAIRYVLRAGCRYEESWVLSGNEDTLSWFDYKAFRYAELEIPKNTQLGDVYLLARHYPFELKSQIKKEYSQNKNLNDVWQLCIHTQKYGVQEVIQDCMEREKGFYLGDGCYTALVNMILTQDDSMVRKLIDDAFASNFIVKTLVTCMDCSFMQEIAEFPLIMVILVLWHYRLTNDIEYLKTNYTKVVNLLEAYRTEYEKDGLLRDLDKWCVVEWPQNFRHGYDADIIEGTICHQAHISINAYYIYAWRILNVISKNLGKGEYRDINPLLNAFYGAFYDFDKDLFRDGENTDHISLVGNSFAYAFDLCLNEKSKTNILKMIDENGINSLSLFCTFPILMRFAKDNETERLYSALTNENDWVRMLREDATTTFEGWGKDVKWNTSLFHLTMSYVAVFLADVNLKDIFE